MVGPRGVVTASKREKFEDSKFSNAKHGGCVPAYCHVVVTMRPCVGRVSSIVASSKTHPDFQNPVGSYWV